MTSRSSPTTTSAVKEKRRPPLTTLATRLISTTRSWRSRPAGLTERSIEMDMSRSEGSGSAGVGRLDGDSSLADGIGERAHVAVILVATAVEYRLADACGFAALGKQLAGAFGALGFAQRSKLWLKPADSGERVRGGVVDKLGTQSTVGAEHGDTRAGSGAGDLRAHPTAAFEPAALFGDDGHERTSLSSSAPHGHVEQAGQGRRERGVLRTRATEDADPAQLYVLMRAFRPCAARTRPRSGCPCPCMARAGAACG